MADRPAEPRPFEVLVDTGDAADLPAAAARLYRGGLGLRPPVLYSNFVSSIDGVVATMPRESSGSVISGKYWGDRFLMAVLRAHADAVLLGAGTLNSSPGHAWTAAHVFPDMADDWTAWRAAAGLPTEPRLVVVTASGRVDVDHRAIQAGATVVTTEEAAGRVSAALPGTCEVWALGSGLEVDLPALAARMHAEGMGTVLTEGGPTLMGSLLSAGLLDEVFLTLSPLLAGRHALEQLGMVEGISLMPDHGAWSTLVSARRSEDYLFLRYRLRKDA
ncbi:MAG: hypothetical protein QOE92_2006 [Chloroflexota bacterium]|nr:hypothetical protein [Chloroflexota bacterium]